LLRSCFSRFSRILLALEKTSPVLERSSMTSWHLLLPTPIRTLLGLYDFWRILPSLKSLQCLMKSIIGESNQHRSPFLKSACHVMRWILRILTHVFTKNCITGILVGQVTATSVRLLRNTPNRSALNGDQGWRLDDTLL
jgi:hypothetical protein